MGVTRRDKQDCVGRNLCRKALTSTLGYCVQVILEVAAIVLALLNFPHFGSGWGENLLQVGISWLFRSRRNKHLQAAGGGSGFRVAEGSSSPANSDAYCKKVPFGVARQMLRQAALSA